MTKTCETILQSKSTNKETKSGEKEDKKPNIV